jgi:predicted regulator of Ras-like GTPase activity (Roadblock/LC7/MglB family)
MTTAEKALAELTEISAQVQAAVLFDRSGAVAASTLPVERAELLARAAKGLLDEAELLRGEGETAITQLEASTGEGSLFVVRQGDDLVAAVTGPQPTAGLVFYDLKSCLRAPEEEAKPKPRRKRAKTTKSKSDESA